MTQQEIATRMVELQKRRDTLEIEARQHEQLARDKRSERETVKNDLEELRKASETVASMTALQETHKAANDAKAHAEAHANSLAAAVKQAENLNKQLEAKLAELNKPAG